MSNKQCSFVFAIFCIANTCLVSSHAQSYELKSYKETLGPIAYWECVKGINACGQWPKKYSFAKVCLKNPMLCAGKEKEIADYKNAMDKTIEFSGMDFKKITEINQKVNRLIEPVSDQDQYGVIEKWVLPTKTLKGDCEDYALLKRQMLIDSGYPLSKISLAIVEVEQDNIYEGHAVLLISTTSGDFVLDNLRDEILLWNETKYIFIKREAADGLGGWFSTIRNDQNDYSKLYTR